MKDSPRAAAATVVGRVMRSGAYSNVLLAHMEDNPDGRLARRLVYGTLRHLLRIDRLLAAASRRRLEEIEPGLLDTLRIATWELHFGDGAPHAAVHEAVTVAEARFGKPAAGFANAVLRSVSRAEEQLPPGPTGAATRLGVAPWVLERLADAWGEAEASEFLARSLEPAPRSGRIRPGSTGVDGRPVPGIAEAVVGASPHPDVIAMDPASVAVVAAARIEPGMAVLDLTAAPGGKTLHAYDRLERRGRLIASDRHPRRAKSAKRRLDGLDAPIPWVVADGRRPPFGAQSFDRVLVDAPCTGLGTLRRRPEIRHRLTSASPGEAAAVQSELVASAMQLAKPTGLVVYSACTVFPEETTDIVARLNAEPPTGLPGRRAGKGWLLAPHLSDTDGMFISLVHPR